MACPSLLQLSLNKLQSCFCFTRRVTAKALSKNNQNNNYVEIMFFPLPAIDRRANGWTDRWIDALFISLTKLYVKRHDFQLSLISSTIPSLFTCWKIVESCFCFFIVSYLLLQITASNLVDGLMFAAEPVSYAYGPVDAFSKGKTPCLSKNIGVVFYNSAYTTVTSVGVQPFTVHLCSRVLEGERTSFLLSISKPSHVPY